MASINWDSVATAGAVAVVVTLAIEYAAKPRLEARKERILDAMRTRRDLMAAIVDLSLAAGFILEEVPKDAPADVRQRVREERQRQYSRMVERAQALFDDAGRYARPYVGPARGWVVRYIMCVNGVVLSQRTQHRKAEIIKGLALPIANTLDGPIWRLVTRVKALLELDRLIRETERVEDVNSAYKLSASPPP